MGNSSPLGVVSSRQLALGVRELGDDFFDEHRLHLIDDAGRQRLEVATIRQPVTWDWPLLAELFAADGRTIFLNIAST